jgi:outer membrane protein
MRIRVFILVLGAVLAATGARAQEAVPAKLSLQDAISIARSDNPTYLQSANDSELSDWDVREAWGQLLPSATANTSATWQGSGNQQFGAITLGDLGFGGLPSYYMSSYNLSLALNLSWSKLLGPAQAKANRGATIANTRQAEATLISQVTTAYLEVLRQQEAVTLASQQLDNARINLKLAQGRREVGSATAIDVGQAQVQVGRANVTLLQAQNALKTAHLRLFQQMGVSGGPDVTLTTTFELTEPPWTLEDLYARALKQNPTLQARVSSKKAAELGVSSARSAYYPSLSISTGFSGFTREASTTHFMVAQAQAQVAQQVAQCVATNDLYSRLAEPLPSMDCSRYAFTDAQRQAIINQNNQFPFDFQKSPFSVSVGLSIPIFQGLSRQRNLEAAKLQKDDMVQQVRQQEIALRADLSVGLSNVQTAYQSAILEESNQSLAQQQLRLARERYQVGTITFVDLVNAETVEAQANSDRISAVYAYQDAVTNLETLVGGSLRN